VLCTGGRDLVVLVMVEHLAAAAPLAVCPATGCWGVAPLAARAAWTRGAWTTALLLL
jgi:hypothetical protein